MIRKNIECPYHKVKECGTHLVCNTQLNPPSFYEGREMVPPFCIKQNEPNEYIYSYLCSHYTINDSYGHVWLSEIDRRRDIQRLYLEWYKEFYCPTSHIPLKPLTNHHNQYPSDKTIALAGFVREISRIVDRVVFDALGIKPKNMDKPLVKRLISVMSIESILFTPIEVAGRNIMRWYFTIAAPEDRDLKNIVTMREFATETTWRGPSYDALKKFIPQAVKHLEKNLGCDQYVGTQDFRYSPRLLIEMIRVGTSGGIMDAKSYKYSVDDIEYKVRNSGSKIFLYEATIRQVHAIMTDLANGLMPVFQPYNETKIKDEIKYIYTALPVDLWMKLYKSREFYIPSMSVSLIARLLHDYRMKIERGTVITIGVSGWHGGWYQLAKILHYDNPDLFWADGDIKALDKHIPDFMLNVYLAAGSRYYAWDRFNLHQKAFLKRIYLLLMYHMVNKITLQPGDIWRLIQGVMYSGGPETSHGDSWIMAVVFYTYIFYVAATNPSYSAVILATLEHNFIAIIVYGDDHIWCCPKKLRPIINVLGFFSFLRDFWRMELRDYKEYDSLISEVDIGTGVFRTRGPKFLKKYFIRSFIDGAAPIIPYKETLEPLLRMCAVTNREEMPGLILKSMGQAWDSMGTNPIIYQGAKAAYEYATSKCTKTPREIVDDMIKENNGANRRLVKNLLRKYHLSDVELFDSFPTLSNLQSRHVFTPILINNKKDEFSL